MTKFGQLASAAQSLTLGELRPGFALPIDRAELIQALADVPEAAEISRRLADGLSNWLSRTDRR
jgi:hypothetical protein